jgi:microsomal epoxide hydrolase
MHLPYLKELLAHWHDAYDWRACERRLFALPHYTTRIEDLAIHFIHVPADGEARRPPLLITHGWPGSVLEFLDVIEPLAQAGCDLVIPSLPGYGFSQAPETPIGPREVARLWRALMVEELGYGRYVAQGGDWGSVVTGWLGHDFPDEIAGIHMNMMGMTPRSPAAARPLDAEEKAWLAEVRATNAVELGYYQEQATKPQTLAVGLSDSPAGLAAWIAEKFWRWGDTGGDIESRFTKDALLDNITLYWLTNSIGTSTWMYYGHREAGGARIPAEDRIAVPSGFAAYQGDFVPFPPRQWAERMFDVVHWSAPPRGGHFAAMEEPRLFVDDLLTFLDRLATD